MTLFAVSLFSKGWLPLVVPLVARCSACAGSACSTSSTSCRCRRSPTMEALHRNGADKFSRAAPWYFRWAAAMAVTGIILIGLYADNLQVQLWSGDPPGAIIGPITCRQRGP